MNLTDNKGKRSKTLFFVAVSWFVIVARYALGGLDTFIGTVPVTSATDFGIAIAAVLSIWLGREWKETHYADKD